MVFLFAAALVGITYIVVNVAMGDAPPVLGPLLTNVLNPAAPADPNNHTREIFTVQQGWSAREIGAELEKRGLVRSALGFRLVVDQEGVGGGLTAGDYELSPAMSALEIVQVLSRGEVRRGIVLTIPEGWRAEQIADRMDEVGFASGEEFLRAVADPRLVPGAAVLGEPLPPSLEGYLFPWTYEVRERVSGVEAAEMMVRTFHERVGERVRSAAVAAPDLTMHEIVTVASIVEREARVAAERPMVASVYLNRLDIGMPLQADPTVQYAVASGDGAAARSYGYWRQLTLEDLETPSPYNSYVHPALPPGPICSPGEASILAVLAPASTDYYYFVAKSDGSGEHLFGRTLDEHNANVARSMQGQ